MSTSQYSDTVSGNERIKNNFQTTDNLIRKVIQSNGIYDKTKIDWYSKFARIPIIDPYNTVSTTREYVFITKPDLHLVDTKTGKPSANLANNSFFVDAVDRYRPVIEQLQSSAGLMSSSIRATARNPFMTVLSNSLKSSLDLPDIEADTDVETGANVYGTKLSYRGTSMRSDEAHNFSLEFEDTKYLEIYMLFKIYDEYERMKWLGLLQPSYKNPDDDRWINYTLNKVLHDQVSIYKIIVGEDGMTILYFARLTGCYPNGAPRSAFSDMSNVDGQRLTVEWKAQFVRDMDPRILVDFNRISLADSVTSTRPELPLYDMENHMMNGELSRMPYIEFNANAKSDKERMGKYYLKWKQ